MAHTELVIFGLLVAVAGLAAVARIVRVPYPIPLTIGGLALGFAPGVPDMALDPNLVLLIFLPPLLYSAAFFANLRELRDNLRPITGLAVGLVAGTMAIVAVIATRSSACRGRPRSCWAPWSPPPMPWPRPRSSPAERSPARDHDRPGREPDQRLDRAGGLQVRGRRRGHRQLLAWEAGPEFVFTGVGGIAIGVAVGIVIAAVRRRVDDPLTTSRSRC